MIIKSSPQTLARPALLNMLGICCLLLGCSFQALAAQESQSQIVIGEEVSIFSTVLDEERKIFIGLPDNYESSEENYPVMFVLDGEAHFHYTTGITRFLAVNQLAPQMIVVSIANTDRTRDMTPPSQEEDEIENFSTHGGADNFLSFIGDELAPYISENYRTRPYTILAGHSFGGILVVHALSARPELFDAYIAISPSLWWNDQRMVAKAEAYFDETPVLNKRFYMTMGNEGGDMLGGARKLAGVLDDKAPRGFEWEFEHMPLEHHGSVPHRSTYDGLEFVYSNWYLRDTVSVFKNYGYDAVESFYKTGGAYYGYERDVPLNSLSSVVQYLSEYDRLGEARELLRKERPIDPIPAPFYEFLAGEFQKIDELDDAKELYLLALEINPGSDASRAALTEMNVDFSHLIPDVQVAEDILASYVGNYRVPSAGIIEVKMIDGKLVRFFAATEQELYPSSDTEFYQLGTNTLYKFVTDEASGEVSSISIDQGGPTLYAQRIE